MRSLLYLRAESVSNVRVISPISNRIPWNAQVRNKSANLVRCSLLQCPLSRLHRVIAFTVLICFIWPCSYLQWPVNNAVYELEEFWSLISVDQDLTRNADELQDYYHCL